MGGHLFKPILVRSVKITFGILAFILTASHDLKAQDLPHIAWYKYGLRQEALNLLPQAVDAYRNAMKLTNGAKTRAEYALHAAGALEKSGNLPWAKSHYVFYLAQFPEDQEVTAKMATRRWRRVRPPKRPTPPKAVVPTTRLGAVWRSALIPGWGQMYRDRPLTGLGLLAGDLAAAGVFIYYRDKGDKEYQAYKNASNPTSVQKAMEDTKAADQFAAYAGTAFIAIYSLNLVTAAWLSDPRQTQTRNAWIPSMTPIALADHLGQPGLQATWHF